MFKASSFQNRQNPMISHNCGCIYTQHRMAIPKWSFYFVPQDGNDGGKEVKGRVDYEMKKMNAKAQD